MIGLAALLSPFLLPVLCFPKKPAPSPYEGKAPCRTDEMCPPGHSCVTEDAFSVGVCEPMREEVPPKTNHDDDDGAEWFGMMPAPSGMTMVR
jgi:hypothetical protein